MAYTLRSVADSSYVVTGLAGSHGCIVRPLGGALLEFWTALWRDGVAVVDDPTGAVVLRYFTDAGRNDPPPPTTTPPVDTVHTTAVTRATFATMNAGALYARDYLNARIADPGAPSPPYARSAWVLRGGRVVYEGVSIIPAPIARPGVTFSTSTLAHAVTGAIVAAPDGSTYLGDDVWQRFVVVNDGVTALPQYGNATIPASTPAVTITDASAAWSTATASSIARGESTSAAVCAVAADGTLWLGRDAADVDAITSTVTTFGALAVGSGLVAYYTGSGSGVAVGASWRMTLL